MEEIALFGFCIGALGFVVGSCIGWFVADSGAKDKTIKAHQAALANRKSEDEIISIRLLKIERAINTLIEENK